MRIQYKNPFAYLLIVILIFDPIYKENIILNIKIIIYPKYLPLIIVFPILIESYPFVLNSLPVKDLNT